MKAKLKLKSSQYEGLASMIMVFNELLEEQLNKELKLLCKPIIDKLYEKLKSRWKLNQKQYTITLNDAEMLAIYTMLENVFECLGSLEQAAGLSFYELVDRKVVSA